VTALRPTPLTHGVKSEIAASDAGRTRVDARACAREPDVDARGSVRERSVEARDLDARAELEQTLLRLMPALRRWLYRMLAAPLDDALQDALIELALALPRFEGRASLESFARTITVRVAYRYFKRRESAPLDPEQYASSEPWPDHQLAERRALLRLHRCLAKLSPKRRTAFVLCGIEELSPHEAAALVGTSAGSMRARFMHARAELARYLGAQRGEECDG
jgi:RNA polymerase sigma-70 factor (ECF subfamily)